MPTIMFNEEEFDIVQRVALHPILGKLDKNQWLAIVDLVSTSVFNHHVEWCGYVHSIDDEGDEPIYSEPSRYYRPTVSV